MQIGAVVKVSETVSDDRVVQGVGQEGTGLITKSHFQENPFTGYKIKAEETPVLNNSATAIHPDTEIYQT